MKLKNFFKKNVKKAEKTNLKPLDEKQLKKVSGGTNHPGRTPYGDITIN